MFLRKAYAFLKRDAIEAMSYKTGFALDFFSIAANLLIFFFIAKLIDPSAAAAQFVTLGADGGGYFPYVLIGMAFASYQTAALNGFGMSIHREINAGTLEAIAMTPTSLQSVILYGASWNFIGTSLRVILYLALGAIFFKVDMSHANLLSAAVVLLFTIASLASFGILGAGMILVLKQGNPVGYFLSGASRFLSGVYFPAAVLPLGFQKASLFLPLTYALEAMRKAVYQGASLAAIRQELMMLALFTVLLLPLGVLCFNAAVQRAKKDGSLAFY